MNKSYLVIDVREPSEYANSHIKGALNIPPDELMAGSPQLNNIPKNTKIIAYCKTGSRSNVSIQILKQFGFSNLENGINAQHVAKNYKLPIENN